MFFEEPSKESSSEVSNLEALQENAVPTQTPSSCNFYHEQIANQQVNICFFLFWLYSPASLLMFYLHSWILSWLKLSFMISLSVN